MKPEPPTDIVCRLRCAAGHLNAVIQMAESGHSCEDVLHQLRAVEAALHVTGQRLVTAHIRMSQTAILASSSPIQRAQEFRRLISLYSVLMHGPYQHPEVSK